MSAVDFDVLTRLEQRMARREQRLERVPAELRAVLDARDETPAPLAEILGIRPETARKREQRDPGLRALTVGTRGRRRTYQRSTVLGYLAQRTRGR